MQLDGKNSEEKEIIYMDITMMEIYTRALESLEREKESCIASAKGSPDKNVKRSRLDKVALCNRKIKALKKKIHEERMVRVVG